ncbi:Coatomer subunit beta'-2 [Hibiscus syriacus]|uniref:Beta'-coat protein n=2 Tax=Hibiscus syriacus TaxID=106335 RepID=A0A6A2YNA1_HIBSY|nr:Coatomer subunit beta'-2 [Hibiscus syriacus]
MPLRLEIKRKLAQRSERVKSVDLHPTEPWILASLYTGTVCIWNYQSQCNSVGVVGCYAINYGWSIRCVNLAVLVVQTMSKSFEVTELPVRSAKFVARKQWVVAGADDMFIVYNYNTMDKVKVFEAHTDYIRCVAVHPTLPYVLSSSDDMLIKLWDWEKGWVLYSDIEGHSHYVMQVTFNPKDTNTFASASLDHLEPWLPRPNFTLDAHQKGVNCVDYFTGGDKPYLITGSDDHTAKVWDYQTKSCVQTLEGHTHNVSAVCFHPDLPIIITGSEDGTVRIWHAATYRLENTLNYGLERVWAVGYMKGSLRIVIGYEGTIMVKIGREVPVASMDNSGKIIWAKQNEIQTVNIKSVGADFVTDGERLPLAVKELGTCDLYPQSLKHNPNGRFVVVCGDGEYIIYTALAWRNRSFGSALECVWSSDSEYAVRESTSKIRFSAKVSRFDISYRSIASRGFNWVNKILGREGEKKSVRPTFSAEHIFGGTLLAMCSNDFICFYDWAECRMIRRIDVTVKNLYWADSGDLVAIASDTSFYILKYNRDVVQSYLESGRPVDEQGVEDAFELLHETNERVRTGIWVGDCFIYNNSSWRLNYCVGGEVTTMFHLDRPMYLLGYLASQSRVYLIDKEFNVMGYTLLLSLIEYKTLVMRGDLERANEILSSIPKEHHNSVARFLESRGMVEEALEVATDPDYRFELAIQLGKLDIAQEIAAQVQSESKWKQLGKLALSSGKLTMAEECMKHALDLSGLLLLYSSLGDAEGISRLASLSKEQGKNNVAFLCLFMLGKLEDCLQLLVESNRIPEAALMARSYLPNKVSEIVAIWRKDLIKVNPKAAESLADPQEYSNLFEDWELSLSMESKVAERRSMQVEDEEPLENGDVYHEAAEPNGLDQNLDQNGEEGSQEEAVVVDADSNDGAVLINGNEPEEEWGMNNEGSRAYTRSLGPMKTFISQHLFEFAQKGLGVSVSQLIFNGDAENALQPSKKRPAGREISRNNPGLDDEEDSTEQENGTFKRASDEVLANRRIVKVRKNQTTSAASSNPFSGICLVPPAGPTITPAAPNGALESRATTAKVSTEVAIVDEKEASEDGQNDVNKSGKIEEGNNQQSEKTDEKDHGSARSDIENVEQSKSKEEQVSRDVADKGSTEDKGGAVVNEETQEEANDENRLEMLRPRMKIRKMTILFQVARMPSRDLLALDFQLLHSPLDLLQRMVLLVLFHSWTENGQPFGFGLSTNGNSSSLLNSSGSSVVSKIEGSGFQVMPEVPVETGEENEKVVFSAESVLFEFIDGAWKERGKGELKVNVSTAGTEGARVLMRARGNYRLILNARLYPDMKLTNMDKRGITFACMNSTGEEKEGLSTFALKFKDASIVEEFRVAVTAHKGNTAAVLKTPENSPKASED